MAANPKGIRADKNKKADSGTKKTERNDKNEKQYTNRWTRSTYPQARQEPVRTRGLSSNSDTIRVDRTGSTENSTTNFWKIGSRNQFEPSFFFEERSSGDVVITQRLLFVGSTEHQLRPKVVAVNTLKAFLTVGRSLLIQLFEDIIFSHDLNVTKMLLSISILAFKRTKRLRKGSRQTVPERDAISPKLLNFFLIEALTKIDNIAHTDPKYCQTPHKLPSHMEHADDTDITMVGKNDYKQLLEIAENTFKTIKLSVNHDNFGIDNNLGKVGKLVSLLFDFADLKTRNNCLSSSFEKIPCVEEKPLHKITAESFHL